MMTGAVTGHDVCVEVLLIQKGGLKKLWFFAIQQKMLLPNRTSTLWLWLFSSLSISRG